MGDELTDRKLENKYVQAPVHCYSEVMDHLNSIKRVLCRKMIPGSTLPDNKVKFSTNALDRKCTILAISNLDDALDSSVSKNDDEIISCSMSSHKCDSTALTATKIILSTTTSATSNLDEPLDSLISKNDDEISCSTSSDKCDTTAIVELEHDFLQCSIGNMQVSNKDKLAVMHVIVTKMTRSWYNSEVKEFRDANTSRHGKHHVKGAFCKVLHCIMKGTEIVDKKLLEASIKK